MIFLDRLARARDELWMKHRSRETPSSLMLKHPWPRGAPIQFLSPFLINGPYNIPFVETRARSLVFADPDIYLAPWTKDKEEQEAIIGYMDDWSEAVRFYVRGGTKDDRGNRIKQAWEHAIGPLSESRMSPAEAHRFWVQIFAFAGIKAAEIPSSRPRKIALPCPRMPRPDDKHSSDPLEWTPDSALAAHPTLVEGRELAQTCLDIILKTRNWADLSEHEIPKAVSTIPGESYDTNLWAFRNARRRDLPADSVDMLVASALLYLNSGLKGRSPLLMSPFPSIDHARFPAVYLSDEFLERKSINIYTASAVLDAFRRDIPVNLLGQLACSVVKATSKQVNPNPRAHREVAQMVRLLWRSDNPQVAIPFVQDILKQQEERSWHRLVLHSGLLCSLAPAQAQDALLGFATSLFGIKSQEAATGATERGNTAAHHPGIKVTMVKMLAQLLRDAPYVTPRFAVHILGQILPRTKHIDIHVTALTSLTDIGLSTQCESVRSAVINLLRQHALPRASSLNEYCPETEEQWQAAETVGEMPELWNSVEQPPVLHLLMNAAMTASPHGEPENEFQDVLMDTLRAYGETNLRWMELFVRKYGFTLRDEERLPPVPPDSKLLGRCLSDGLILPGALWDAGMRHVVLNIKPGPGLADITASVKKNTKLRNSNAGKRWLSLWDQKYAAFFDFGGSWLVERLATITSDPASHTTYEGEIIRLEAAMGNILDVHLSDGQVNRFDGIISRYMASTVWSLDMTATEKVLQRFVDKINDMRTEGWQRDRHRRPAAIPSTFNINLYALQMLYPPEHSGDLEPFDGEYISKLAAKTIKFIDGMVARKIPYHNDFERMKNYLGFKASCCFQVAIFVGSVDDREVPDLSDYLRVDLVVAMLKTRISRKGPIHEWEESIVRGVRKMLISWQRSHIEHFRDAAGLFQ